MILPYLWESLGKCVILALLLGGSDLPWTHRRMAFMWWTPMRSPGIAPCPRDVIEKIENLMRTYEGPLPTERPAENNCCEANWDILTSQHGTHRGARRFQYNFLKFAHLRGCNETLVCAATSPITFSEIWPRRLRSTFEAGICGSLCLKRQKMRACSALLGCYSDAHVNSDWCFQKIQDCVLKLETDSV